MLTALFITWAIVLVFAIMAFGWRDELKTARKELQSMKMARGEQE